MRRKTDGSLILSLVRLVQQYWYNPDTKETTWFHPVTKQTSVRLYLSHAYFLPGRLAYTVSQCASGRKLPFSDRIFYQGCQQSGAGGAHAGGGGGAGINGGLGAPTPSVGQVGASSSGGELPLRPGAAKCAHFLKTGSCRFGAGCKYDHPPSEAGTDPTGGGRLPTGIGRIPTGVQPERAQAQAQQTGLPVRPGERDCAFFVKTGSCKYGSTCRWNHPPELQQDGGMAAMMMRTGSGGGAGVGGAGVGGVGMGGTGMGPMMNPMAMMSAIMVPAAAAAAAAAATGMGAGVMGGASEWETHISDEGRPYYYNARTLVSQWDPPAEVMMQQKLGGMGGMGAMGLMGALAPSIKANSIAPLGIVPRGAAHPIRKS